MKQRFTVILFLFFAIQAHAQQIRLVKDINHLSTTTGYSWQLTVTNDMLFFVVDDGVNGEELWKSDGSEDGTMMVRNLAPGGMNSYPAQLTPVNDLLFFTAWEGDEFGRDLYKTDGTEGGTVMIKAFVAGDQNGGPQNLTELDGILYFLASDGSSGYELWRSDGTEMGTYRVKGTAEGWEGAYDLVKGGDNKLYFFNYSPDHGYELWTSDGTEFGTYEIKDILEGTASGVRFDGFTNKLITHDHGVYFVADDGEHGRELWKSDGTSEGTVMVKDFFPGQNTSGVSLIDATSVGDKMFFRFGDAEVWSTQGTEATTNLVKIVMGPSAGGMPGGFTRYGDNVLFVANTNPIGGHDVWISDGTDDGTVMLRRISETVPVAVSGFKESNGSAYFVVDGDESGIEPWITDGSEPGTNRLFDLVSGSGKSFPTDFTAYRGETFFTAENETFGRELFRSNGTVVKDIHVLTQPGVPYSIFGFQGNVYFQDFFGGLWKSDGTEVGTDTVKGKLDGYFADNLAYNGKHYFLGMEEPFKKSLFETDGTYDGTKSFFELDTDHFSIVEHQGFMYFFRNRDLFKSDGTEGGTQLIKTVDDDPGPLYSCGAYLYFSAGELWRSDGTEAGTVIVEDIVNGNVTSAPFLLTPSTNGILYFAVETAPMAAPLGVELWRSDGSEAGTFRLKSFERSVSWRTGHNLEVVNNVLFFSALSEDDGHMLWKSDGTELGTVIVLDVYPTSTEDVPWEFKAVDGTLFFVLETGSNDELWKSDGTPGGTLPVKKWDYAQDVTSLLSHQGELFFISSTNVYGWGVGRSDGTATGTVVYYPQEPAQDPGGSIYGLLPVDDKLYFTFQSARYGDELYVLDIDPGVLCRDFSILKMEGTAQACTGGEITLNVTMAYESAALTYTWYVDNVEVPDQTTSTLSISSANLSDAGTYTVMVSDGSCSATANSWKVKVKGVPNMIEQDITKVCGNQSLGVVLSSFEEIYTSGYNIVETFIPEEVLADPGNATASPETLVAADYLKYDRYINTATLPATVEYVVSPVSMMGCTGDNITVFFEIQPQSITDQPDGQDVCEGGTVNLTVETIGNGTYQWKKNNVDIPDATEASLIINNAPVEAVGDYAVAYNDGQCITSSEIAVVNILLKPTILEHPQGTTIDEGSTLSLSVSAAGENNEYLWKKNNAELGADSSPFFSKPNATPGDNGNYQVVVTNTCGSSTSNPAAVVVVPTPSLDVQSAFTGFVATAGQFSFPQSYTISGANLQGPVEIEIDAPFEISTSSNGGWQSQLALNPVSGTLAIKTLYVRFVPEEAIAYSGSIRHYAAPALLIEIPLDGSGLTTPNEKPFEDLTVSTYPNPVDDKLFLEFKAAIPGTSDLLIYTLEGLTVHTTSLQGVRAGDVVTINTSQWKSGGYVVMVKNESKKVVNKKIFKIR
jgi:ELWxxDGT repeat protein